MFLKIRSNGKYREELLKRGTVKAAGIPLDLSPNLVQISPTGLFCIASNQRTHIHFYLYADR